MANEFGFVNAKLPESFANKDADSKKEAISYIRLNKCHDFKETKNLWKNAAKRTARIGATLVVIYLILGYFVLAYLDGMRGIDCWYFLATTLTTVGLGDLYPSKQITRAFAIFMLPFGLIIISFGISLAAAQAEAMPSVLPSDAREKDRESEGNNNEQGQNKNNEENKEDDEEKGMKKQKYNSISLSQEALNKFKSSRYWSLLNMLCKYFIIIFIGAFIMFFNEHEVKKQENNLDDKFTFVDAMFFATVVATTVGYGHEITPLTDTSKLLMIPYMFISTFIVGGIIGDLSGLYLSYKEDYINDQMIESTTWVHRADLDKDGLVSEADFVLFKLQQMQKVDRHMLERLIERYHELDVDGEGALDVGIDIPSAEHVKEMQRIVQTTGLTLPELWRQIQPEISAKAKAEAALNNRGSISLNSRDKLDYIKLSECHDFLWSKTLWKKAADETAKLSVILLFFYIGLGSYLMAYRNGLNGIDAWYFLIATLTTVGYGDFAPEEEFTRGCSIVMIPFGLAILGFGLSYLIAYANSKPYKQRRAGGVAMNKGVGANNVHSMLNRDERKLVERESSLLVDEELDTVEIEMSLKEPLGLGLGLRSLKVRDVISHSQASQKHILRNWRVLRIVEKGSDDDKELKNLQTFDEFHKILTQHKLYGDTSVKIIFDKFPKNRYADYDDKDVIRVMKLCFPHFKHWLFNTVSGKCLVLLFKMFFIVFVGALFFKLHPPEVNRLELTWIDALYFASVTATSIGYGDITSQSNGGKLFLCFYMLISTIWMADCLGDFIDLYVHDVVGEGIIDYIIDSTTWVHKCDLDGDGRVSEADYVLFKLQQMQKVDAEMMDMLIDRYHELDVDGEGALDVGIDIPSAEQVQMMQDVIDKTNTPRSLVDLWKDMQESLQHQRSSPPTPTNESQSPKTVIRNPMKKYSEFQDMLDATETPDMSEAQRSKPSSLQMVEMSLSEPKKLGEL